MKSAPRPPLRNRPRKVATQRTGKRYLVIGGHGMLGSHIVEALLARGEEHVGVLDLSRSPLFADEPAVRFHQGSILDRDVLRRACEGVDTVLHTAASVSFWADLPFELGPTRGQRAGHRGRDRRLHRRFREAAPVYVVVLGRGAAGSHARRARIRRREHALSVSAARFIGI